MRHLLDYQDVDKRHLEKLIEVTKTSEAKAENLDSLAILKFDEPSTRTSSSLFEIFIFF